MYNRIDLVTESISGSENRTNKNLDENQNACHS